MKNILQEIAGKTRERVAAQKKEVPLNTIKATAMALALKESLTAKQPENSDPLQQIAATTCLPGKPETYAFYKTLKAPGISLICEVKKASPSKGLIAEDFPYLEIAKDYEAGGAAAISVLTEPFYFLGSSVYLEEIRKAVSLPLLRKDFIVDEYQIYETKLLGADACLLICAILEDEALREYLETAHSLGLNALVETHNPDEIERALQAGANIIGVNNRNLKDFSVDTGLSASLRRLVPEDVVFVAESGIHSKEQLARLKENGADAALIGETFMRAADRRSMVAEYSSV